MNILYAISIIIILLSFILIKKSSNKLNICNSIVLSITALFCFNVFVCYVLTFFTIPTTLLILSIINLLISLLLIFFIRKNGIQKYEFKKIDLLYIILLGIVVVIISYLNFGFPFNIKYETGDPSVHYLTSEMFSQEDNLLVKEPDEVYGGMDARKTASYVNSGIIMKCFSGIIDSFYNYNIFIIFGIFILFLTGWGMYSTISEISKNEKIKFLAFLVSLIYTLGYPLNSFLFGFEYLSMGILIFGMIINIIQFFKKEEFKPIYYYIFLFLLNFGLFSAYYMFVPFVYTAIFVYFCMYSYEKHKKIITKSNIRLILITLIIPFILGYIYHLAPSIYRVIISNSLDPDSILKLSSNIINSGFATYGYIYVNLYSNMLLLLPIPIYLIIKKWRTNKFEGLVLAIAIFFIEVLLVGHLFEKVSIYYIMKNYFALWLILWYMNFKGLVLIYEKKKWIAYALVFGYIWLIVLNLILVNNPIESRELNKYENIGAVVEVFGVNKTIIKEKQIDYTTSEIEILKYAYDNLDRKSQIEILGDMEQGYWAYPILRYVNNQNNEISRKGEYGLTLKIVCAPNKIGNVDYIIYFNRSQRFYRLKDKVFENAEVIFENQARRNSKI